MEPLPRFRDYFPEVVAFFQGRSPLFRFAVGAWCATVPAVLLLAYQEGRVRAEREEIRRQEARYQEYIWRRECQG